MNFLHQPFLILAASVALGAAMDAAVLGPFDSETTIDFDDLKPGPLPSGWEIEVSGGYDFGNRIPGFWERDLYGDTVAARNAVTPTAEWKIIRDSDAPGKKNVLQVSSIGTDTFCVKTDVEIRDGYLEVQANSKEYKTGRFYKNAKRVSLGLVWRYQDPKNFYAAYTESSKLKLVKMVDGHKEDIDFSGKLHAFVDEWHTVRVEFTGGTFKLSLDGRELFSAVDREIHEAGAVGLIVNDAFTHFDNLSYGAFASSGYEDFNAMEAGKAPPAPWKHGNTPDIGRYYPSGASNWQVVMLRKPRNNVLRQSSRGVHPYCVKSDVKLRDGYVEVEAKSIFGEYYKAMGVIWRWQDENNYYVARGNAPRDSISIFKVVNGSRSFIERSSLLEMPKDQWHTFRVEFSDNKIEAYFNGRKVVSTTDDTFTGAGAVGVWTKLDSHTLFDNLSWGEE